MQLEVNKPVNRCELNRFKRWLSTIVAVIITIAVSAFISHKSYTIFHNILGVLNAGVAFAIFVIVLNTYKFSKNTYFILWGITYGFVGVFDFIQVFVFDKLNDVNMTAQLWIASRYIESLSFIFIYILFRKVKGIHAIFFSYVAVTALILLSIFNWGVFPDCYITGSGLTIFKMISDNIIVGIFIASLALLIFNRRHFKTNVFIFMIFYFICSVVSGALSSIYENIYDFENIAGHIFDFMSTYFVYKAIIKTSITAPYESLNKTIFSLQIVNKKMEQEIAERNRVEKELNINKTYLQQLFENSPQAIVMLDNMNRIVNFNKQFVDLFQYKLEEVKGSDINNLIATETLFEEASEYSQKALDGEVIQIESVRKRKDGSLIDVVIIGYPVIVDNKVVGICVIYRNITDKKKIDSQIKYISFHDSLTGLYNRAYFEEEINRLDTERQLPLSLIMGDLNGLKFVNDVFGHKEGDRLLIKVSEILKSSCRTEDIIARWGGDEFVILLPKTNLEEANRICSRIKEACRKSSETLIKPSISLGIATKTEILDDIHKLFTKAEDKMYNAKTLESKDVRESIIETLKASMWGIDYKNKEHGDRMERLAAKFGQALNLYESKINELRLLAQLHDIGKIAVSGSILRKPDKLSPKEWEAVKRHSEVGCRIAQYSGSMACIAEYILTHHEWWDGTGYPKGLKGEEIPIISRIISIVDAFDAITNERPYDKTFSKEEALEEIESCSGTQFDPYLVNVFANEVIKGSW